MRSRYQVRCQGTDYGRCMDPKTGKDSKAQIIGVRGYMTLIAYCRVCTQQFDVKV